MLFFRKAIDKGKNVLQAAQIYPIYVKVLLNTQEYLAVMGNMPTFAVYYCTNTHEDYRNPYNIIRYDSH